MNVSLVMFKADGTRRDFPLTKDRIVVGRKNDCDLRIPLTSVSRQHCELRVDDSGDEVKLRDLGSSNGTYHNNSRVQEATLEAGDKVVVGPVVFTVVIDGEPEDIEPVHTIVDGHASAGDSPTLGGADQSKPLSSGDSHSTMPGDVEDEHHSPTVELDDDPIAALEALAAEEDEEESAGSNANGVKSDSTSPEADDEDEAAADAEPDSGLEPIELADDDSDSDDAAPAPKAKKAKKPKAEPADADDDDGDPTPEDIEAELALLGDDDDDQDLGEDAPATPDKPTDSGDDDIQILPDDDHK